MFLGLTRRARWPAVLAALGALASPAIARAGDFAADGTFFFDPTAAARDDFEEGPDPDGGALVADDGALSGKQVLKLSPQGGTNLPVMLPTGRATYRVSAWIRGGEVAGSFEIAYGDRVSEVAALYPTGRMTSDGWVEIGNDHLRVDGARLTFAQIGLFAAGGAVVDGLEVVADGGAADLPAQPNAACHGLADAGACAPDQMCVWSECRNVSGWVPPIPEDREAVTDYLAARIHLLFGPYLERTVDMPAVDVYLSQMRQAKDRWSYWNGFLSAIRRLHDGHTTTSGLADFVLENPRPLSICFLEGDADLSHGVAPKDADYLDVLVSHTGADHNLGLKPGDRLVAIDGQHPIGWARSLLPVHWSLPPVSNHVTFAELSSSLGRLISRYAGTISVIRCDAAQGTCGAVETIDIAALPADPPGTTFDRAFCDNRPKRHVPGAPADHEMGEAVYSGLVNDAAASERIYGLEWDSLFTTDGNDYVGAPLKAAVAQWKVDARGVILDHRVGFGGTITAPEILWNYAIPRRPNDVYVDRTFGEEEQPTVAEAKAIFEAAKGTPFMQYVGSNNPVLDVPVALLVTEDVSASDWLAEGFKNGPKTRVFGPFQTNGGFSTRYAFGYWLGMDYVMAVGDDIMADGTTHNGRGVEPDVVVRPKQSDLLVGKDTVFEAALAWVRSELKP